jgi:hypothetical protein
VNIFFIFYINLILFILDIYFKNLIFIILIFFEHYNGDWGLGIGDWGVGIWANPPNPIPQNPDPKPQR